MMNIKLDVNQRQIIIIVIAIVLLLGLFLYWWFYYMPKKKEIDLISIKLKDFDLNIKEEEAKIQTQNYEKEVERMQQEIARLKGRFPSQTELPRLFKEIFNQTERFNIEIISIIPGEASVYESKSEFDSDLIFYTLPINLELKAHYRSFAEFIRSLYLNQSYAFSFDEFVMTKIDNKGSRLKIKFVLKAFILSYKAALVIEELPESIKKDLEGFN